MIGHEHAFGVEPGGARVCACGAVEPPPTITLTLSTPQAQAIRRLLRNRRADAGRPFDHMALGSVLLSLDEALRTPGGR